MEDEWEKGPERHRRPLAARDTPTVTTHLVHHPPTSTTKHIIRVASNRTSANSPRHLPPVRRHASLSSLSRLSAWPFAFADQQEPPFPIRPCASSCHHQPKQTFRSTDPLAAYVRSSRQQPQPRPRQAQQYAFRTFPALATCPLQQCSQSASSWPGALTRRCGSLLEGSNQWGECILFTLR